jgi:hypothetical protein
MKATLPHVPSAVDRLFFRFAAGNSAFAGEHGKAQFKAAGSKKKPPA